MKNIGEKKWLRMSIVKIFIILFFLVFLGYAGWVRATVYEPGETLNPDCSPVDPNCGVEVDSTFNTSITVTNGSVSSSLQAGGLYIATSTSNLSGLFFVDNSGNASASGTLRVFSSAFVSSSLIIGQGTGYQSGKFNVDGLTGNVFASGTLDISSKLNPVIVGGIASSTGSSINGAWAVQIRGKYAYVGTTRTGDEHFNVIDISDPYNPNIVGTLLGQGSAGNRMNDIRDLSVSGNYAYVLSSYSSVPEANLHVVDISDPTTPTIASRLTISTSSVVAADESIEVVGNYAYITNSSLDSLFVVSIANPKNPTIVGTMTSSTVLNYARGIVVSGKYAYISSVYTPALGGSSLVIADISNPYNPTIAGSLVVSSTATSSVTSFSVSGKYAYLGDASIDAMYIVDISSSTNPMLVGQIADSVNLDATYGVRVSGKYAYAVARNDDSLRIIDVSSSTNPALVGGVKDSTKLDGPTKLDISGKYAYIANSLSNGGFYIVDIGGIDAPAANIGALQVNTLNVTDNFNVANNAYISKGLNVGSGGIMTDGLVSGGSLEISMRIDPVIVGGVKDDMLLNGASAVFISGKYAYVGINSDDYFNVVDISDPQNPVIVGTTSDSYLLGVESIHVSGKYAYALSFINDALSIIDISNPTAPTIVKTFTAPLLDSAREVYVSGKYAYVASYHTDSLSIIDVSNPSDPFIVGSVASTTALNGANAIYVSGKYAYVGAEENDSLYIVDISNPTAPVITGGVVSSTLMNWVSSVYVSGKYAYVGAYSGDSLTVVDISSSTAPTIVGSIQDNVFLDGIWSVKVAGKYAYAVSYSGSALRIIDISSSTAPKIVGGIADTTDLLDAYAVDVSGKYAYIVNNVDNSLRIIDIGGIDAPSAHIGSLQSSNISVTENITIGNNAYITNGLNVGSGGIMSDGSLSAAGTTTLSGLVVSSSLVYMPALVAPGATSDYLCFDTGGKITHQAGNCTVSSQRFKHDIVSWNNGLSTILNLRPVTYKRNHDEVEELGLIAEEVDLVDKHLVIYEPSSTTPRSVDYARLVIPLISAVQSQQSQIDGLLLANAGVNSSTPRTMSEEELLYAANRPLASAMTYLINRLSDGATVIKDFLAERVTAVVGVFERVKTNEMEMTDSVTGDIYCIRIANGDWEKLPGSCDEQDGLVMPEPSVLGEVDSGEFDEEVDGEPVITEPEEEVTELAPSFLDQLIDSVQNEIGDTEESSSESSDSSSSETSP